METLINLNDENNKIKNHSINEANCYVIDNMGNLLSRISRNKGFVYIRKKKASFFNNKPFIIKLDKVVENPTNDLTNDEIEFINSIVVRKIKLNGGNLNG